MLFSQKNLKNKKYSSGFSLAELVVGVTVFTIIVIAVYSAYISIFNVVQSSRAKIEAVALINEQLEIVRNLPYASVGVVSGIPSGVLTHSQTLTRSGSVFSVLTTVRNVDDPFDGTVDGTPKDTSPADFKTVEIEVTCAVCKNFKPMIITTKVAPKNLENTSTNGALFVKVFDANGNALQDAAVHIENNKVSPAIVIDDVTNISGMLQIVDVPPGANAYEITVTKTGYSTDKTYAITPSNPHPTKPSATIVTGQVTQTSFIIDKLSTLSITSRTSLCVAVPSIDFSLVGSKNVGLNPVIPKYSQSKVTDNNGLLTISNMEWDSYTLTNTDTAYEIVGSSVLSPITLSPNSIQKVDLIVAPKNPDTLLISVKDGATGLPLSGVTVGLTKSGYAGTGTTGQGFIGQTTWVGGAGQATSTDLTKYLSSDGNIEIGSPAGDLYLKKVFGEYVSSGELISSSFNVGAPSNFQQIVWNPLDQPASTGNPNVRLQIATNNDGGTWNFTGPDGTASTYYTNSNKNIQSINNGMQYLRYRVLLNSASTTTSPNISDINFTFTSECTPPGQISFSGLSSGSYTINLQRTGYATQNVPVTVSSAWQTKEVTLFPN